MLYVTDAKAKLMKKGDICFKCEIDRRRQKRERKVMDMIVESDGIYKVSRSIDHSMQIAVL